LTENFRWALERFVRGRLTVAASCFAAQTATFANHAANRVSIGLLASQMCPSISVTFLGVSQIL